MSNTIRTLFSATALVFIFVCGCKKKPVEEPTVQTSCETSYQVLFGTSAATNEKTTVKYENGQLKSISSSGVALAYQYSAEQVLVSTLGTAVYQIQLSDKLASRIINLKDQSEQRLSYDVNRNLVKIESYFDGKLSDVKMLTYSGGNLTSLTQTYSDDPAVKRVTTFSYSNELSSITQSETRFLFFGLLDLPVPLALTGSVSKNSLSGSLYTYTSGNFRSDITKIYSYTRDGSNRLTKVVEDSHALTVSNGVQTQDERSKQTILVNSSCN